MAPAQRSDRDSAKPAWALSQCPPKGRASASSGSSKDQVLNKRQDPPGTSKVTCMDSVSIKGNAVYGAWMDHRAKRRGSATNGGLSRCPFKLAAPLCPRQLSDFQLQVWGSSAHPYLMSVSPELSGGSSFPIPAAVTKGHATSSDQWAGSRDETRCFWARAFPYQCTTVTDSLRLPPQSWRHAKKRRYLRIQASGLLSHHLEATAPESHLDPQRALGEQDVNSC